MCVQPVGAATAVGTAISGYKNNTMSKKQEKRGVNKNMRMCILDSSRSPIEMCAEFKHSDGVYVCDIDGSACGHMLFEVARKRGMRIVDRQTKANLYA
jgi:hypothetical protein